MEFTPEMIAHLEKTFARNHSANFVLESPLSYTDWNISPEFDAEHLLMMENDPSERQRLLFLSRAWTENGAPLAAALLDTDKQQLDCWLAKEEDRYGYWNERMSDDSQISLLSLNSFLAETMGADSLLAMIQSDALAGFDWRGAILDIRGKGLLESYSADLLSTWRERLYFEPDLAKSTLLLPYKMGCNCLSRKYVVNFLKKNKPEKLRDLYKFEGGVVVHVSSEGFRIEDLRHLSSDDFLHRVVDMVKDLPPDPCEDMKVQESMLCSTVSAFSKHIGKGSGSKDYKFEFGAPKDIAPVCDALCRGVVFDENMSEAPIMG